MPKALTITYDDLYVLLSLAFVGESNLKSETPKSVEECLKRSWEYLGEPDIPSQKTMDAIRNIETEQGLKYYESIDGLRKELHQ